MARRVAGERATLVIFDPEQCRLIVDNQGGCVYDI